ncbi:Spi family protease inhibitor [Bacteroides salyersiae]|uniref:Spi family protease inhibitor n=1 Tax=Bacteroides salyersiae TaxID=291644 RepID=UPI0021669B84|nr:Spi family protease inhibitor [Bacteroides salyersiae]MCS3057462.1 Spi family protease inhibitor [Bacteroides salyersiae]
MKRNMNTYGMVKARKRVLMPYRPFMFSIVFIKAGLLCTGDDVAVPVLAYSNTGKFEVENMHLIYKTG